MGCWLFHSFGKRLDSDVRRKEADWPSLPHADACDGARKEEVAAMGRAARLNLLPD
jgi:hypothetical protein